MTIIYILLYIFFSVIEIYSQPIEIIIPESPNYIEKFGEKSHEDKPLLYDIHFLNCSKENKLNITFQAYWISLGNEFANDYQILSTDTNIWNIKGKTSEDSLSGLFPAKNIIFDASSVFNNYSSIILNGAGYQNFISEGQEMITKFGLNSVAITNKNFNNYIGGSISYYWVYRPGAGFYQPLIWNDSGYIEYGGAYCLQKGFQINPIESKFSPQNSFFVVRGLFFNNQLFTWSDDLILHSDDERFPYTINNQYGLSTCLSLIYPENIDGKRKWNQINYFYKDAAFTSDDQYMVTEWKGKPTLFKTPDFKTVIKQYDTPSYMTACTISPDNKLVYIACEDHKVYVFDIGIPTAVNNWEIH